MYITMGLERVLFPLRAITWTVLATLDVVTSRTSIALSFYFCSRSFLPSVQHSLLWGKVKATRQARVHCFQLYYMYIFSAVTSGCLEHPSQMTGLSFVSAFQRYIILGTSATSRGHHSLLLVHLLQCLVSRLSLRLLHPEYTRLSPRSFHSDTLPVYNLSRLHEQALIVRN